MSHVTTEAPIATDMNLITTTQPLALPAGGTGDNVRASWRYSFDDIKGNNAHNPPEAVNTLLDAFVFCTSKDSPMRFQTFCERVGYDSTSVDQIYRGKYKPINGVPQPIPAKFLKETRAFLALERERVLGGRNEFVMTPTARKIEQLCNVARESQTPCFLYGTSQIGKTWGLTHYQQNHNHGRTVYSRMAAACGLAGMLRSIAEALRISPKASTPNLIRSIRNALSPDMVLILDEMHLLQYTYREQSFFACIEVIREFYDSCKCGMVLCGTNLLAEKMDRGKDRELQQTLRRGVHRLDLGTAPTTGDVAAIVNHWGLEMPARAAEETIGEVTEQPYEVLRMLARREGLKAITERLRYGRKLAAKDAEKGRKPRKEGGLSWWYFIKAHLVIEGEQLPGDGGWK